MGNKKKVLVVYYTQSGQMRAIADRLVASMQSDVNYDVDFEELKLKQPFPFPWTAFSFFNAFPETFYEQPAALQPFSDKVKDDYDLIVLAYQPWFLTPSPAMSSFLQTADAARLLHEKKVVTIIGCRNMWLGAQEKIKKRLVAFGSDLVGNMALVDKSPNVVSMITILRWMLWGKKEAFGIFPAAGVAQVDVDQCAVYGDLLKQTCVNGMWADLQTKLNEKGAVEIVPELVLMEARGQRAFGIWSRFIGGASIGSFGRAMRVRIFMFLLPTAIIILSPLLALISFLMLTMRRAMLMEKVAYFKANALAEKDIWRS